MVWAQTEDVAEQVRAVVRTAKRADVSSLSVWPGRCLQPKTTYLAVVVVDLLDGGGFACASDEPLYYGLCSAGRASWAGKVNGMRRSVGAFQLDQAKPPDAEAIDTDL